MVLDLLKVEKDTFCNNVFITEFEIVLSVRESIETTDISLNGLLRYLRMQLLFISISKVEEKRVPRMLSQFGLR